MHDTMNRHSVVIYCVLTGCAQSVIPQYPDRDTGMPAQDSIAVPLDVTDAVEVLDAHVQDVRDVPVVFDGSDECLWRAGSPTTLRPGGLGPYRIHGLESAGGDALLLVQSTDSMGRDRLSLHRLDERARERSASTVLAPLRLVPDAPVSFAYDSSRRRGIVLTPHGFYVLDSRAELPAMPEPFGQPMGFPLGGHRDPDVTDRGFTYLGEQIRAIWGLSLVSTDAIGGNATQVDLDFGSDPGLQPYGRHRVSEDFFFLHVIDGFTGSARRGLHIRRYTADGLPETDWIEIDRSELGDLLGAVRLDSRPEGVGVFWERMTQAQSGIEAAVLGWDGTIGNRTNITSSPTYMGGLDLTLFGDRRFVTAIMGSGRIVPTVLVIDAGMRATQSPIALPNPSGSENVSDIHLTTTFGSVIVTYVLSGSSTDASIIAVPLTCAL
jgi:hypothetical protein